VAPVPVHSFAERPSLTCPDCGQAFNPEIWLIVDAVARPDLLDRVREKTIHHVVCPNGHAAAVDAPLLLFRPGEAPPVLFSPPQQTSSEEDEAMARGLVQRLAESLGEDWRDDWLSEGLPVVPREMLAAP
jgi:hypothetical protein